MIGVVTNKGGESYQIDIGSSMAASLPFLAFEGATKKNKPQLKVDCYYAVHQYLNFTISFCSS